MCIRDSASAIVNDESFAQPNVKWDFWLVGNETTRTVDEQRRQSHLPYGVVQDGRYRIVVKQWSEVISDAEHRLKFVQNSLEYETSHDSGPVSYTHLDVYKRQTCDRAEVKRSPSDSHAGIGKGIGDFPNPDANTNAGKPYEQPRLNKQR